MMLFDFKLNGFHSSNKPVNSLWKNAVEVDLAEDLWRQDLSRETTKDDDSFSQTQ